MFGNLDNFVSYEIRLKSGYKISSLSRLDNNVRGKHNLNYLSKAY